MEQNSTQSNNIIRVSISEAARLFGVDDRTIRRAIKSGEVRYIIVRDRYKINFESLLAWSQKRKQTSNKLNNVGIGRYVERWKIKNRLFSPATPAPKNETDQALNDG